MSYSYFLWRSTLNHRCRVSYGWYDGDVIAIYLNRHTEYIYMDEK